MLKIALPCGLLVFEHCVAQPGVLFGILSIALPRVKPSNEILNIDYDGVSSYCGRLQYQLFSLRWCSGKRKKKPETGTGLKLPLPAMPGCNLVEARADGVWSVFYFFY